MVPMARGTRWSFVLRRSQSTSSSGPLRLSAPSSDRSQLATVAQSLECAGRFPEL